MSAQTIYLVIALAAHGHEQAAMCAFTSKADADDLCERANAYQLACPEFRIDDFDERSAALFAWDAAGPIPGCGYWEEFQVEEIELHGAAA